MKIIGFNIYHDMEYPNWIVFIGDYGDYKIDCSNLFGDKFRCKSVVSDSETDHLKISLKHAREKVACPFCGSKDNRIQKSGHRMVYDLFHFVQDPQYPFYDDFGTVFVELRYDNPTYRCTKCNRLYKIKLDSLSSPKMRYTKRVISYVKNNWWCHPRKKSNSADDCHIEDRIPLSKAEILNFCYGFPNIKQIKFENSDFYSYTDISQQAEMSLIKKLKRLDCVCGIKDQSLYWGKW